MHPIYGINYYWPSETKEVDTASLIGKLNLQEVEGSSSVEDGRHSWHVSRDQRTTKRGLSSSLQSLLRDHPRITQQPPTLTPTVTRVARAQGGDAHPLDRDGKFPVDLGKVLPFSL